VDRGQALIPRCNATLAGLLQVVKEETHHICGHIDHTQFVDLLSRLAGNEREQQGKRIAVTALRAAGQVALANQILKEKTSNPGA
jgi:hypothetical protein